MTIMLDLTPTVESSLLAQAKQRGLSLRAYVEQLLEERSIAEQHAELSPQERVRAFDEFVRGMESDAVLPDEAFHRSNWYADRD